MEKQNLNDVWYIPDTCYVYKSSIVLLKRVSGRKGLIETVFGKKEIVFLEELSRIGKRVFMAERQWKK